MTLVTSIDLAIAWWLLFTDFAWPRQSYTTEYIWPCTIIHPASKQSWANFDSPAKRHSNGVLVADR